MFYDALGHQWSKALELRQSGETACALLQLGYPAAVLWLAGYAEGDIESCGVRVNDIRKNEIRNSGNTGRLYLKDFFYFFFYHTAFEYQDLIRIGFSSDDFTELGFTEQEINSILLGQLKKFEVIE